MACSLPASTRSTTPEGTSASSAQVKSASMAAAMIPGAAEMADRGSVAVHDQEEHAIVGVEEVATQPRARPLDGDREPGRKREGVRRPPRRHPLDHRLVVGVKLAHRYEVTDPV